MPWATVERLGRQITLRGSKQILDETEDLSLKPTADSAFSAMRWSEQRRKTTNSPIWASSPRKKHLLLTVSSFFFSWPLSLITQPEAKQGWDSLFGGGGGKLSGQSPAPTFTEPLSSGQSCAFVSHPRTIHRQFRPGSGISWNWPERGVKKINSTLYSRMKIKLTLFAILVLKLHPATVP